MEYDPDLFGNELGRQLVGCPSVFHTHHVRGLVTGYGQDHHEGHQKDGGSSETGRFTEGGS
ncbi:hypothetical protein DFE_2440 [Desulfovibrio ferrophilus]|uniref:Uncharacterized protein n=1 Tax=Desulfovibrio ferrophilus TaxID=241368 RepID=A0A2Z6B193_9BACT|nr:hypothetical protein DFE_2440 [Desulfovibrio ferrophilus]